MTNSLQKWNFFALTQHNDIDSGCVRAMLVGHCYDVFPCVFAQPTLTVDCGQLWNVDNLNGV